MNQQFFVQADTRQIQALILAMHGLSPDKLDRVLVRAENRTMRMARTAIVRTMKEKSTIKHVTAIRKRVIPYEAPNAAAGAAIRISHTRINLIEFAAKQIKKRGGGVQYQAGIGSGTRMAVSAFITGGFGGTKGVFIRRRGLWKKWEGGYWRPKKKQKYPRPPDIKHWPYTEMEKVGDYEELPGPLKISGNGPQRTPRYPIDMLRGPSLWRMFTGMENMVDEIIVDAKQKLSKHVMDQVRLIVEHRKGAVA